MKSKNALYHKVSERDFQKQVIDLAEALGYMVYHVPDSRRVSSRGFPDLTMIHPRAKTYLVCELKTKQGRIRPEQEIWLNTLKDCGISAYVFRPHQIDEVMQMLIEGAKPK